MWSRTRSTTRHAQRMELSLFVAIAIAAINTAASSQNKGLYDAETLRSFYFTINSSTWYSDLQAARRSKQDVRADLKVDNVVYKHVGVRFRGNSSYVGSGRKKSINVTMDAFVPKQELMGYDSLNLSNAFGDPTFCREVVSFHVLRKYGPAPKANHVKVYINGNYFGLFVNVQQPDKTFIKEWFRGNDGNRYRCDPPTFAGYGKSALQWLGTTLQEYKNAYELKTELSQAKKPWEDVRTLCNVLNNTALAQLPAVLPGYLDVDAALWYLAVNSVMVNLDSYALRGNDYYLYHDQEHDVMFPLPWDMNESFGGYAARLSVTRRIALSPFYNENATNRPMLRNLLAIAPWRARYIHHVKTILDDSMHWGVVGPMVTKTQARIDAAVRSDPNLLYGYQAFKDNVTRQMFVNSGFSRTEIPGLKQLCDGRVAAIRALAEYKAPRATITALSAPARAKSGSAATLTARVASTAGIGSVSLFYRGRGAWKSTAMFDDGQHGDGAANDGVYGARVPAAFHTPGLRVHYYVEALSPSSQGGAASYAPKNASFQAPSYFVDFKVKSSDVLINELLAKNQNGIVDEQGETEDWLELYNRSASPIDVGGMFLSDNIDKPTKWRIPANTTVSAGGTLLVWCDDEPLDGPLHATFKLDASGETALLFDRDGVTLLSQVRFGTQRADVSIGSLRDGIPSLVAAFPSPTPRRTNSIDCSARAYLPLDHVAHRGVLGFVGRPSIGASNTALRLSNAVPSSTSLVLLAASPASFEINSGSHLMLLPPLLGPLVIPTNASGTALQALPIPNAPGLRGSAIYFQAFGFDQAGLAPTNGLEIRICKS